VIFVSVDFLIVNFVSLFKIFNCIAYPKARVFVILVETLLTS